MSYTSDENGFIPEGEHIPKPVPFPVVTVPEERAQPIDTPPAIIVEKRLPEDILAKTALFDETQFFGPVPHVSSPPLAVNDVPVVRSLIENGGIRDSGALRSESVINPDGSYHYRYVEKC